MQEVQQAQEVRRRCVAIFSLSRRTLVGTSLTHQAACSSGASLSAANSAAGWRAHHRPGRSHLRRNALHLPRCCRHAHVHLPGQPPTRPQVHLLRHLLRLLHGPHHDVVSPHRLGHCSAQRQDGHCCRHLYPGRRFAAIPRQPRLCPACRTVLSPQLRLVQGTQPRLQIVVLLRSGPSCHGHHCCHVQLLYAGCQNSSQASHHHPFCRHFSVRSNPPPAGIVSFLFLANPQNNRAVLAFLPIPITILSVITPRRRRRPEKFGQGRYRTKISLLLFTSVLLTLGACFRLAVNFSTPRPLADPAWYDSKASFYCFNFVIEIIVVYTYAVTRFDRRFHVPNGAFAPGHYNGMHVSVYWNSGSMGSRRSSLQSGYRTPPRSMSQIEVNREADVYGDDEDPTEQRMRETEWEARAVEELNKAAALESL